jgi:hypothetical protein
MSDQELLLELVQVNVVNFTNNNTPHHPPAPPFSISNWDQSANRPYIILLMMEQSQA